jgi:hypothetical protein
MLPVITRFLSHLNIAGVVKDIDVLIPFAGIIPDAPYDKEKWMKEKEVGKVPKEAPCSNEGSMSPRTQKLYKKQQVFVCVCLCWGIILQNCKETCCICKDYRLCLLMSIIVPTTPTAPTPPPRGGNILYSLYERRWSPCFLSGFDLSHSSSHNCLIPTLCHTHT